jgi:hypothetical protein
MTDARFEDADGRPLRLWATDAEDLQVVSALVQDAVLSGADMRWSRKARRLDLLLSRFRWETRSDPPERVRTMLGMGDVTAVRGQGVVPGDADVVLSLLAVEWVPDGDEGSTGGTLRLTFAGDGLVEALCDCLDVTLHDVARPHLAVSGRAPAHDP